MSVDCLVLQKRTAAKLTASSEDLMKLVENARSSGLEPDTLSDVLSAASLAVGQDCRKQLLMQLILLIQQQLADSSVVTVDQSHDRQGRNKKTMTSPSTVVKCQQNDANISVTTSNTTKALSSDIASHRTNDIEQNANEENEMDKLLAWKNRIANALLASNEQLNNTVVEQNEVSRCSIPDIPVHCHVKVNGKSGSSLSDDNTYSLAASRDVTSCMVTDVLQSVSCCTVSPPLTTHTCLPGLPLRTHLSELCPSVLSPASPVIDKPVEYPPLPTPPKPPANLLMSVDCSDRHDLSAPVLPVPRALGSAICNSSATRNMSDVYTSANVSYHSCLSVPSYSDATAASFDVYSRSQPAECTWLNISAVNIGHCGSHCPLTSASDAPVPLETFSHDASREISDSSCVELGLSKKYVESEAWRCDSTNNTHSHLQSVQEVHQEPHGKLQLHTVTTPYRDLCVQPRTATRLKSPGTWMSRLASPSAFMLQSNVSRSHSRPEAVFDSQQLTAVETSHSVHNGQHILLDQRPSPCAVEAGQLNLTVNDIRLMDIDNVCGDSKGRVPKCKEPLETEYRSISMLHGNQRHDDSLRTSTDEVLMRLAGMPVDSVMCNDCDEAVVAERDAARRDDNTTLPAVLVHDERISQVVHCNKTSGSDCATETSDDRSALSPTDQVTASPTYLHSPSASPAVTVQSSHRTSCEQREEVVSDSELEEGEIVDDCSPTPTISQRELPQATKQLLFFLKTDPVRKSGSSQWQQPQVTSAETSHRHRNDRREDFDKHRRTNSSSRRRW